MKKYFFFVLCTMLAGLLMTGCSSDDEDSASLYNTWVLVSYGNESNEVLKEANGYSYVITHSPMYTDSDIVCSDADGDGYYFWGLGHESKPVNCPAWVPDEPDGDDSDSSAGPMDEYGNLTDISADEIIVSSPVEYSTIINRSHNIRIKNGGILSISNTTTLQNNSQIIVESGGELTVDGGTLNEARITLYAGSTLNIQNDGTISMATGEDFSAPIGASVNLLNGKIN